MNKFHTLTLSANQNLGFGIFRAARCSITTREVKEKKNPEILIYVEIIGLFETIRQKIRTYLKYFYELLIRVVNENT